MYSAIFFKFIVDDVVQQKCAEILQILNMWKILEKSSMMKQNLTQNINKNNKNLILLKIFFSNCFDF